MIEIIKKFLEKLFKSDNILINLNDFNKLESMSMAGHGNCSDQC